MTDVKANEGKAAAVAVPADQNDITAYPIAQLKDAPNPAGAAAFISYVLGPDGQKVLASYVAVRPSAIVISTGSPPPSSACNTWPAKITGLTLLADRVRLDLDGQPPALADVTPATVAELSLDPGSQVWLTVKAADLEVYPRQAVATSRS